MKYLVIGLRARRIGALISASILAVLLVAFPAHAAASDFAVVDLQLLMQDSNASKNVRAQIEKMRSDHQQKIKTEQEQLEKINQSILQERTKLSEEEYQKRMRIFRQTAVNFQSDAQERQDRLDAALSSASQKIAAAIVQIVDEIKKEENFALVLSASATVGTFTDPRIPDITLAVLDRLNQRVPSLSIDPSK